MEKKGHHQKRKKRENQYQMASRERRGVAIQHTLQQLREATNSSALNKESIIVDASKYIEELKHKVEDLNSELGLAESSTTDHMDELPLVTVKTLEKGFLIHVVLEKSSPGMLVSILEAFEELQLDVLDARVSCEDTFQLEAEGRESHKKHSIEAHMVKEAVLRAIRNTD